MTHDDHPRTTIPAIGDAAPEDPRSTAGFRASLRGASMIDVIQLECAHRRRAVVCVRSGARVGYLYFDGGDVVHASTGTTVGAQAVFEILRWQSGTASPCDRAWPARPSIGEPTPALLLRAAHFADEGERSGVHRLEVAAPPAGELIPFARPGGDGGDGHTADIGSLKRVPRASLPPMAAEASAPPQPPAPGSASQAATLPADFAIELTHCSDAAVLDGQGQVVALVGRGDELAPVAAYVAELADLVGQDLGFDRFCGLHAHLEHRRELVVERVADGVAIAVGQPGLKPATGDRR